mgnify:CR=1 FL=1|tara:strand:+ start:241 stop:705 length:465 start_codon:yes stop_codon:yes gene_type:complete
MNRICVLLVSCLITACSQAMLVQAKPSGPVDIIYTVSKNLAIGGVVTTTLWFKAKMYLQQLVVSASPDRGLTLESSVDKQVFTNIEIGAMREVEISIMLIDSKGYVSVGAETTDTNGRIRHNNKIIKFNSNMIDTTRSKSVDVNTSEKLILMPS